MKEEMKDKCNTQDTEQWENGVRAQTNKYKNLQSGKHIKGEERLYNKPSISNNIQM